MFPHVARFSIPAAPGAMTQLDSLVVALAGNELRAARRRARLAAEARRIARRRWVAEAVALRTRRNDRGLAAAASVDLAERARRKSTRLNLGFHRALEVLWEAGGFDEALAIARETPSSSGRGSAIPRPHLRFDGPH